MPITNNGFEARKFVDILSSIEDDIHTKISPDVNTSENTILGILLNLFSSSISDEEQLLQLISDNMDIDKASSVWLDRLVALLNLKRLGEGYTVGNLYFTVSLDNTIIPSSSSFSDGTNTFTLNTAKTVNALSGITSVTLLPNDTTGTFTVSIDGTDYSATFSSYTPLSTISQDLATILQNANIDNISAYQDGDNLVIESEDYITKFTFEKSTTFDYVGIEDYAEVVCDVTGQIDPAPDTITTILTGVTNLTTVINKTRFNVGRSKETDYELRKRFFNSYQSSSSSVISSIFAKLSNISSVTNVNIIENKTLVTDSGGRPGKSYECIVEGGDEATIGQTIWDTKPAAIETYGNTLQAVIDYANNTQYVSFSRPENVYFHVRVTYSLYTEQDFPAGATDSIKQAVVDYGNSLLLGTDIYPEKFYGSIYSSTTGLGPISVEIGTSVASDATSPDLISYQTTVIPLDAVEKPNFDITRVELVEV